MAHTILKIKVIPNSSREQIVGWLDDSLKVKLQAPPEDGKANKALKRLLASAFKIGEKQIVIESGERSPEKLVKVEGVDYEEVKAFIKKVIKK